MSTIGCGRQSNVLWSSVGTLAIVFGGIAFAQQPTFRSQTSVVLVPTLVKDAGGHVVYGLHAQDFLIEADGIEQPLRLDEAAESEPVFLVVAVQRGRRAFREFDRMHGLASMLQPLLAQDQTEIAVVAFDSHVQGIRYFTHSSQALSDALHEITTGDDGAAILDAVDYSIKLLDQVPPGRRRALLLISETRDHGSHVAKLEDVVESVGKSDVVIYALSFSPSVSQVLDTARGSDSDEWANTPNLLPLFAMTAQALRRSTPKAMTSLAGGEYQLFKSRRGFENYMVDFVNHLHNRYLLSFEPRNPQPGLHQIRVRLRDPEKRSVVARTSYWAGAPPRPEP